MPEVALPPTAGTIKAELQDLYRSWRILDLVGETASEMPPEWLRILEIARNLIWPMLVTDESYVHSAFAAIDAEFGSVEALLAQLYGIGPAECARLQDLYLV